MIFYFAVPSQSGGFDVWFGVQRQEIDTTFARKIFVHRSSIASPHQKVHALV